MRPWRLAEALLSLTLATAGPIGAAEVPQLLADINTSTPLFELSAAQAFNFVVAGDRLLFSTSSYPNDDEGILWLTDGTASGTGVLSSSLCPDPCAGIAPLGTWHGLALLKGNTGLWRSDGTAAGTFPLTAPLEDNFDFAPLEIVSSSSSNVFYFRSCQQPAGCLLWRSDGTRAGTFPLAGPDGGPSAAYPHALAFWGGKLYFLAGSSDFGLWSTDGTIKGTSQLASVAELDEYSGTIVSTPSHLFFTAGDTSEDLWVTDGTPDGTRLVADFPPVPCFPGSGGCDQGDVSSLFGFGDSVFFFTHPPGLGLEIWRSDGTPDGTGSRVELAAVNYVAGLRKVGSRWLLSVSSSSSPDFVLWTASDDFSHTEPLSGCDGGACPSVVQLFSNPGDGLLLFAGTDAAHGTELWITDGTGGGTHRLSDACPGACSAFEGSNVDRAVLGSASGLTFFRALPSATANPYGEDDELWVTDGTAGGTHRVFAGHVSDLGVLGGLACFGFAGEGGADSEFWATDGTAAGTRRLTTLQRRAPGSEPLILKHGGGALLLAWNGSREGVWRSDGTPGGTYPVPGGELDATRELSYFMATQVGPLQFFRVDRRLTDPNAADAELWRTDGTGPGTRGVASFGSDASLDFLTPWGGKLLFLVETQADCTFWSSDGTSEGTRMILPPVPGRRCPTAVAALDGSRFIFVARVEGHGGPVPQIFLSDGTPAGTRQISALRGSREALDPDSPVVIGGIAFLRILGPQYGDIEIWRTDGTPAGTFRTFKNLVEASELFGYRGFLYFTARTERDDSRHLYRVAARGGGEPVALAQATPAEAPQYFSDLQFTPANDRLFFTGWDADAGFDLWVTDGTPAGTRRVRRPGSASCAPDGLAAAGNRVFFSGDDGEHGRELWESDGTPGGTRMVWDLNPGGFSSNPASLVASGNYLFFSADDGTTGTEPWALRLEP